MTGAAAEQSRPALPALRRIGLGLALLLAVACAGEDGGEADASRTERERPLEVTYLANTGYLVAYEDDAVLVDALFDVGVAPGLPPRLHDHLDPERLAVVLGALPPFDRVGPVLVTHGHDDHFTADSVASFLESNPGASVFCPADVAEAVRRAVPAPAGLEGRLMVLDPDRGASVAAEARGIEVLALGLPHPGRQEEGAGHNAYLVRMGPHRFLHLGDAAVAPDAFASLDPVLREGVDVVFAPYWFVEDEDGVKLLRKRIHSRHVVITHANRGNRAEIADRVAGLPAGPPEFILFEQIMERRYF